MSAKLDGVSHANIREGAAKKAIQATVTEVMKTYETAFLIISVDLSLYAHEQETGTASGHLDHIVAPGLAMLAIQPTGHGAEASGERGMPLRARMCPEFIGDCVSPQGPVLSSVLRQRRRWAPSPWQVSKIDRPPCWSVVAGAAVSRRHFQCALAPSEFLLQA